jgi:DNA topoisomerase I
MAHRQRNPEPLTDPVEVAKAAHLRYVNDGEQGITRKRKGKGFQYLHPDGKPITDADERARIDSLAIPPAWTDVWICPDARGHIQVTGRDAKGRKQYRYHARWRETRDSTKFERMILFGEALPDLRERVAADLRRHGLPREKVLAAVVALLGATFIRVGNREYERDNESYGLTTMHDEHVEISGSNMHFEFRGKSGKEHAIDLQDKRLAKVVKQCQDVPGQHLFKYYDEGGSAHTVTSEDVNAYLREISGQDFTAKDFRTWGGTILAIAALEGLEPFESEAECKKNLVEMYKSVSEQLGNTVAVCRKYYVHPLIVETYQNGVMAELVQRISRRSASKLEPHEQAVMALLHERLMETT